MLGGGFGVAAWDYLSTARRRRCCGARRSSRCASTVRLAKAELGTAAGLIGAAFVGFEALDAA